MSYAHRDTVGSAGFMIQHMCWQGNYFFNEPGASASGRTDKTAAARLLRFEVGDASRSFVLFFREGFLSSESETMLQSLAAWLASCQLPRELRSGVDCELVGGCWFSTNTLSSSSELAAGRIALISVRAYSRSL